MLQVILGILKIILFVLLAILGLVLLLVLLVLFSPIKYKIDAKINDKTTVNAKINFLIASIMLCFNQETKNLEYCIKLFGIKLKIGKDKENKKSKKSKKKQSDNVTLQNFSDDVKSSLDSVDARDKEVVSEELSFEEKNDDFDFQDIEEFDLFDGDIAKDVPREQIKIFGRIKVFVTGLIEKIKVFNPEDIEDKINSKINPLKKKIHRFKRFWELKCTVKTRKYLKKYLLGLVKHIGPRKIKGYVRYGFGDPCKTGQFTGYISMLPFVYQKQFSLIPDFYERVIEADVTLKGKIRIGYILRIVLNINIWRTILVAKKIFKGKKEV